MSELKPCPFCGGEPELIIGNGPENEAEIWCDCCGAAVTFMTMDAKPVSLWNARAALADDPTASAVVDNWLSGFGEPPRQLTQLQRDWLVIGIAAAIRKARARP